jgi:hypothetical protein
MAVVAVAMVVVAPAGTASAAVLQSTPIIFQTGSQAETVVVTHAQTYAARKAAVESLHQQLVERQVAGAEARGLTVRIPAADAERINRPAPADGRLLVGTALTVGMSIDLGGTSRLSERTAAPELGALRSRQDGGFVWSGVVSAPGASAVRLHFSGFDLPEGAALYVYGADGQAKGPYTGRGPVGNGELYTNAIFGEQVHVQLVQAGTPSRLPGELVLESVGYMGPRFLQAVIPVADGDHQPSGVATRSFCSYNESCVENAACQSSSAVADARQAVASILFQSGANYYICTGGLLADTAGSQTPYFLTANHCISKSGEASSLETFFDYVTTCSNPDCSQPYSNTGQTVGATILSHSSNNDHSFLQLSSNPATPDGTVAYLGWNSSPVANTNGFNLYRISHPSGAPQAYSEHSVDTGAGTCTTLPRGDFIYSNDTYGATEGGSSGSPVVDGDGNVVGQLYGACGTNVGDVCDSGSNSTVDGAFAVTYPSVAEWLDPSGGPSCSSKGESCTNDSDCCSNKCKGKSGSKTCK